jgi:hypothetical protein
MSNSFDQDVATCLSAFGIGINDVGQEQCSKVLRDAKQSGLNKHEAALFVAYAYAASLHTDPVKQLRFQVEHIQPVQNKWLNDKSISEEAVLAADAALEMSCNASQDHFVNELLSLLGSSSIPGQQAMTSGSVPFNPALPEFSSHEPVRVYQIGQFMGFVVEHPKSLAEKEGMLAGVVEYFFAMAITSKAPPHLPVLIVTAERSGLMKTLLPNVDNNQASIPFLCAFDISGEHRNYGQFQGLDRLDVFCEKAIKIAQDTLRITDEPVAMMRAGSGRGNSGCLPVLFMLLVPVIILVLGI